MIIYFVFYNDLIIQLFL